jgi:hypothetical protein
MPKTMIACVDYDGTIVENAFPEVGTPVEGAFEVLKELKVAGWKLILYTCREDEKRPYLTEAVEFCRQNGVEFDGVNATPLDFEFRDEKSPRRKPFATVYIDDRNLGGFPGWDAVRQILLGEK